MFAQSLREKVDPIWQRSFDHPFVREIADGTLKTEKFIHYVRNDAYYLTVFAQVQAIAASKSSDLDTIQRMAFHAQSTVNAERSLHDTFFQLLGVDGIQGFRPAPTAYQYTSHLLAVAHSGSLAEIIASILPCYWLYWEIGQKNRDAVPNHPIYTKWIETYGNEWFGDLVEEQIDRLNRLAIGANEVERQRMAQWFMISSQYEFAFWEMAYSLEDWPF